MDDLVTNLKNDWDKYIKTKKVKNMQSNKVINIIIYFQEIKK